MIVRETDKLPISETPHHKEQCLGPLCQTFDAQQIFSGRIGKEYDFRAINKANIIQVHK